MIYKGSKEIKDVYRGTLNFIKVYHGSIIVYEDKIKSCFGNGYWDNALPWNNEIGWKN